jgi:hypothetical protein
MTTVVSPQTAATSAGSALVDPSINVRAEALAVRLEQGARALADFARSLTDTEWRTSVPHDGRTIGVVVHHVASVYPVEIHLASVLASGQPVTGVTMDDVHAMNAQHALQFADVTKEAAIELLLKNSEVAAAAIRALSDAQLDLAATASLYANAPVTCQFMLEDHAVRHSYHHLAKIRATLGR